jgi:hypothetical protein
MSQEKHTAALPSPRTIRRACGNELYRTIKRLKVHIPAPLLEQAEQLYVKKVIENLMWINENRSNRKILSDWWDEAVSEEIAVLWNVDLEKLRYAFRNAFGG